MQKEEQNAISKRKGQLEKKIEDWKYRRHSLIDSKGGYLILSQSEINELYDENRKPTDYQLIQEIFREAGFRVENIRWSCYLDLYRLNKKEA